MRACCCARRRRCWGGGCDRGNCASEASILTPPYSRSSSLGSPARQGHAPSLLQHFWGLGNRCDRGKPTRCCSRPFWVPRSPPVHPVAVPGTSRPSNHHSFTCSLNRRSFTCSFTCLFTRLLSIPSRSLLRSYLTIVRTSGANPHISNLLARLISRDRGRFACRGF